MRIIIENFKVNDKPERQREKLNWNYETEERTEREEKRRRKEA